MSSFKGSIKQKEEGNNKNSWENKTSGNGEPSWYANIEQPIKFTKLTNKEKLLTMKIMLEKAIESLSALYYF
jgi:hypothetical protein